MSKCQFCGGEIERKIYKGNRKETLKHFQERKYCSLECLKKDYSIKNKTWSNEEEQILIEGYKNKIDIKEIAKKLNKTPSSIKAKAHDLGIANKDRYYTEEQINFIKDNSNKLTYEELSNALGKNEANICRKMKELGIEKVKMNSKAWGKMTPSKIKERNLKQRETKIINGTLNPMIHQKNPYSRAKGGKRKDLDNIYFRSAWESNIARYYNFIGVKWEFEPKTFIFKDIKRGSVSYTPDFYLPEEDKWVEVKGWMDGKSKTKLKRFKQQYPEEYKKLELITEKEYNEIKRKIAPFIKGWE